MSEPKDSPLPDTRALAAEHERLGRAAVEIVALFDEPLPEEGVPPEEVFEQFRRSVVPHLMNIPSPRYFGLFNPTPLPVAVWADALISAVNQNGAAWRNSPSASAIEARVLRWLCQVVGYGPGAFGTLTSGGAEANHLGLQ